MLRFLKDHKETVTLVIHTFIILDLVASLYFSYEALAPRLLVFK